MTLQIYLKVVRNLRYHQKIWNKYLTFCIFDAPISQEEKEKGPLSWRRGHCINLSENLFTALRNILNKSIDND